MAKQIHAGKQNKALLKLIERYYADLADFARQRVLFEMGTRPAFHRLMADAGKPHRWTLIAEQEKKVNGRTIRPDGTFKDEMNLVRGYWEAKDAADNLDAEIEKKRRAGYPLTNIVFEDTQTAVLYQHGQRILSVDMKAADKLAELVVQFFRYVEPEIEEFEKAVEEFKERVPDLAEGLKKKIEYAHRTNPAFKRAFGDFFDLCRTSLNPNISQVAVDEMLIQHILTERLIREIFDNPEFVRRNVIAAEVEKVMVAMTSHSFDRNTYLKDLDRFYVAIEHAARTMTDWSDKQYFLNTVYERFFQGYSVKLADTMGIVYTPQEIVDFMCASVAEVLEKEFGKHLWSDDVYIIDPCTGTGNFIVNLIRRIPKAKLEDVYKHRLFANEIMLLPYYIAALNIEHANWEQTGKYEEFEGLCFVDTLDLSQHAQSELGFMTAANGVRVERQRKAPITVVLGNPPYNAAQENENDNNKNRKYPDLDQRIRDTYVRDSSATLKAQLYDPYVRFFRWAVDRLGDRDGIVCYVSNNGFVTKQAFEGMRRHLSADFSSVYHVDLHGDVRENPKLSGTTHNVFGIQVGVGITVAVKRRNAGSKAIHHWRAPEDWRKDEKLAYLTAHPSIGSITWRSVEPDERGVWIHLANQDEYESYLPIGNKTVKASKSEPEGVIFRTYSGGVKSNRDAFVYDFDAIRLGERMAQFVESYNTEVDRYRRAKDVRSVDDFVNYGLLKWDGTLKGHLADGRYGEFRAEKIRQAMFRPFTPKFLFFDRVFNNSVYLQARFFPNVDAEHDNRAIVVTNEPQIDFSALMVNKIACLHLGGRQGQCFPFYVYGENGKARQENVTNWALKHFQSHYRDDSITKWDVFHYTYALLHHRGYRTKFAPNLKRGLPRIPFASAFRPLADAGAQLSTLHVGYEEADSWSLDWVEEPGAPLSYHVVRMSLSKDRGELRVNDTLLLRGIPRESFEYRIGNRTALEWVIDQYRTVPPNDTEPGADPNRADEPEYIVRHVERVIRVSVETAKIIARIEPFLR